MRYPKSRRMEAAAGFSQDGDAGHRGNSPAGRIDPASIPQLDPGCVCRPEGGAGRRFLRPGRLRRGFTLIEIVVVLAIFLMVAFLTVPQFLRIIYRARIEGTAREATILLRAARYEAIKRVCYGVVKIDPAQRKFIAFADVNRDGLLDTAATPPDVLIGEVELPKLLDFKNETGSTGTASVLGLFNPDVPTVLPDRQVIYREDGSLLSVSSPDPWNGLRIGDVRGNVLEVYVSPGVGKVQIRKHLTGTQYVAKGDGEWTYK